MFFSLQEYRKQLPQGSSYPRYWAKKETKQKQQQQQQQRGKCDKNKQKHEKSDR